MKRKFMKIIASSLTVLLIASSLVACGKAESTADTDGSKHLTDVADASDDSSSSEEKKDQDTTDVPSEETPSDSQPAAHQHSYVNATCTAGGTCSCGAVGGALGHQFSKATCTAPSTCARCGITNGGALGHSYSKGRCVRCGDTNGPLSPAEANLFNNKLSDEENAQALTVARDIVRQINERNPSSDFERVSMAAYLVSVEYNKGVHVEKGNYYHTAYGVFVKRESSCAGCTRALGLVLSCMGYQWKHVNENQWTHQWVSLTINGQPVVADGQMGSVWYGDWHPYVER